jgi:hypothetical protein
MCTCSADLAMSNGPSDAEAVICEMRGVRSCVHN